MGSTCLGKRIAKVPRVYQFLPQQGLGAVSLQVHGKRGRLHPCTFFSRNLSSVVRNYDIGNRELLVVKVTLEEWRHWLEEARQPFIVYTDHRNLEYNLIG